MGNSLVLRSREDSSGNGPSLSTSRISLFLNSLHLTNSNRGGETSVKPCKKPGQLNNVSFASHFMIAGRRFKNLISQTQTFLFGDQLDLSFILAHKPVTFPYNTPLIEQPSKYLQSLVNIRKDTIRLVKITSTASNVSVNEPNKYNIEFRFDCDCDIRIKIYYFSHEKFTLTSGHHAESGLNLRQLVYTCGCANHMSRSAKTSNNQCFCLNDLEGNVFTKGANILFQNHKHVIVPAQFDYKAWQFNINSNYFPIVIECTPIDLGLASHHAHITLAYIDKFQTLTSTTSAPTPISEIITAERKLNSTENLRANALSHHYQIKPIKQKQLIDGVLYSLQEIYGIEKKISPDFDTSESPISHSSVSGSNTSSSIATQNSNLTLSASKSTGNIICSAGSRPDIDIEDLPILSQESHNDAMAKKRQMEQEIEQEMKGIECVICMCETRDTLILPCRHLCLCKLCAINLRVQSNNCPICRIPFIALLQLKLVKKKIPSTIPTLFQSNPNDNLPIVRMENLPIVRLETMTSKSLDISHENVIIEENFEVRAENQDKELLCMLKPDFLSKDLMSMYETVTIYEAFNSANSPGHEAGQQTFKTNVNNDQHLRQSKSKRFKIKILDPIRSSSDFVVLNVNEVSSGMDNKTFSENTIPKLFQIQNISAQREGLRSQSKEEKNDLRCSSVVLNKTLTDSPEKQALHRSSSFIDNLRQINKFNESIQMEEVSAKNIAN